MKKNMKYILIIGIILFIIIASFTGIIPGLDILGAEGYETQSKKYGCYQGNPSKELLLPEDRKGFITSYRDDINYGLSETIVVAGNYQANAGWEQIQKYYYIVKYKADPLGSWAIVSQPGDTVNWITVPNPGKKTPTYSTPGYRSCDPYVFNIRGKHEGALRVELWGYFDPNTANPLDTWEYHLLSSDQAFLVSGKCGMWLPPRPEGGYQSTFEIGETVKIQVETGVGAPDVITEGRTNEKTWELHLLKPDGSEYTDQNFPRKLNDHFQGTVSFVVYDNMFTLGGDNRYKLELYNTLWKQGTLEISTIDFRAKRPSEPVIIPDCGLQIGVPSTVHVTLKATPNVDTQLPIQSFGVMVWYGTRNDLAPGDWGDERWILRQTTISASKFKDSYTGSFTFEATSPNRYITIIAYAHDIDGRDSDTEYYQIKTYGKDSGGYDEDDLVDEGGGQGSYGGGTSGETTPWDWDWGDSSNDNDLFMIIISIIIFVVFCLIAFLFKGPPVFRILIAVLGMVVAVIVYMFFSGLL